MIDLALLIEMMHFVKDLFPVATDKDLSMRAKEVVRPSVDQGMFILGPAHKWP